MELISSKPRPQKKSSISGPRRIWFNGCVVNHARSLVLRVVLCPIVKAVEKHDAVPLKTTGVVDIGTTNQLP